MRIAEVAERTGSSPATLRELPAPARYRAYDEAVLDRPAFIARAKRLGCTLDEVAGLMPQWDGGRCAPVQAGLRDLAATKLDETRARRAELAAFTADLDRILAGLGSHTPDGPCDPQRRRPARPAPGVARRHRPRHLPDADRRRAPAEALALFG